MALNESSLVSLDYWPYFGFIQNISAVMRFLWNGLGFLFLGVGIVGFIVPHMPGTVFLVIALGCFQRGANERLRKWMFEHRWFGKILTDWEENRSIPKNIKILATSCIVFFTTLTIFSGLIVWGKIVMALLGLYGIYYILSRATSEPMSSAGEPNPIKIAS